MKKIFSLVIALLSVQVNTTMPMASLHALKDSVLKDKGLAFVAAGAGVALVTSLAAATYCYKIKKAHAKQEAFLAASQARIDTIKKENKEHVKKDDLLLGLSELLTSEKLAQHKATLTKLSPDKELPAFTPADTINAWEKELKKRQDAPEEVKVWFSILFEEWTPEGFDNIDECKTALTNITNHEWFKAFEKECTYRVANFDLEEQSQQLSLNTDKADFAQTKSRNWSTLVRGMNFGYLISTCLALYGKGYGLGKKLSHQ